MKKVRSSDFRDFIYGPDMKAKVRNYLWTQPYVSRFNDEGKKAKSKGNHIWNIEARREPDPSSSSNANWVFRKYERKITVIPQPTAYVGIRWHWTPKVWDPHSAKLDAEVRWSCEEGKRLEWLVWEEGTLEGVPGEGSEGGEVKAVAEVCSFVRGCGFIDEC